MRDVDLVISFDKKIGEADTGDVVGLFEPFGFRKIVLVDAGLSEAESIYIKVDQGTLNIPELGRKSGPNLHWIFNQRYLAKNYTWALQYEVDVFPLEKYWYETLVERLNHDWLLSGPIYRGPTRLGGKIFNHVNGNSFYNCSNDRHSLWVDFVRQSILTLIAEGDSGPAFDVAPFVMLNRFYGERNLHLYKQLDSELLSSEDDLRLLLSAINYNNSIWNFSGVVELRNDYVVDFDHIRKAYSGSARLVHSSLYRYWMLGEIARGEYDFSKNEKLFVLEYCKKRLFPSDARSVVVKKILSRNLSLRLFLKRSFLSGLVTFTEQVAGNVSHAAQRSTTAPELA